MKYAAILEISPHHPALETINGTPVHAAAAYRYGSAILHLVVRDAEVKSRHGGARDTRGWEVEVLEEFQSLHGSPNGPELKQPSCPLPDELVDLLGREQREREYDLFNEAMADFRKIRDMLTAKYLARAQRSTAR